MSDSGSSITWSDSADSYFSDTSSSSSSWHCPAPRHLASLIGEQLRRMKCRNNYEGEAEQVAMGMVDQDQNVHLQHLACSLRKRLERLNAESYEDIELIQRSPKKVSFLDQPSCSGVQPTPSCSKDPRNFETVQEIPSTPEDFAFGGLEKFIHNEEKSIFCLNFPDLDEFIESITTKTEQHDVEGPTTDVKAAEDNAEDSANNADAIKNKSDGKVKLYDDGRVTISFGDKVYKLFKSDRPAFDQEVVRVDQVDASQIGVMSSLGTVQHYIDVSPQSEDEDDNEEICTDEKMKNK